MEEYFWGAPEWFWPSWIMAGLFLVVGFGGYARAGWTAWRGIAYFCKVLAILALVCCLLDPQVRSKRPRPQANLLPILVDTSHSLQIHSSVGSPTTAEQIALAFASEPSWLTTLEQMFDVRKYVFSSRLDRIDDDAPLSFEGTGSNLRAALSALTTRYQHRPVAGCLLFTDGIATDVVPTTDWSELGFPVYPVRSRRPTEVQDLRLARVAIKQTDFETAPVTIDATVEVEGVNRGQFVVMLRDEREKIIQQQTHRIDPETRAPTLRFRFRPEKSGLSFYRLDVRMQAEESLADDQQSQYEVTLRNNRQTVVVNQRRGPFSVLYVAGRPNWEYKFLRRAIDADAEVRLVGLLRIAKRQPKFTFRDDAVQSSANPLFAGLGGDEETAAEQLDEAVILRFGVAQSTELAGGFPTNDEELFPFSAVILDDLEADFFTTDQLLLLRRFVTQRGGSLLMLGGDETMEKGSWDGTPLEELSPVYFPRVAESSSADGTVAEGSLVESPLAYRLRITREGMLEPFLRLRPTEQAEETRLQQQPPLRILNQAQRIKPGGVLLAEAEIGPGTSAPALVWQPFGRGKATSLLVGDLWRWFLQRPERQRGPIESVPSPEQDASDDPAQTWRQLVRWLVSDVQRELEARVEAGTNSETLRILADVRNPLFAPDDQATVKMKVIVPTGEEIELGVEPDLQQSGTYGAEFWPREPGPYRVRIEATRQDASEIGSTEVGWVSDPAAKEFERVVADEELLQRIASTSGGEVLDFQALDEFPERLRSRPAPVEEVWTAPLWHRWWVCLLAVGLLCSEWGIRRWKGMA